MLLAEARTDLVIEAPNLQSIARMGCDAGTRLSEETQAWTVATPSPGRQNLGSLTHRDIEFEIYRKLGWPYPTGRDGQLD